MPISHFQPYASEKKQSRRPMVFVFGSNTAGIHGAGAARAALLQHGAVMGKGVGHHGDSYAIPTKGQVKRLNSVSIGNTLPLKLIHEYVNDFITYARQHPELTFQVTQIGCGLAGLKAEWIAPMFQSAPENCQFDLAWREFLETGDKTSPKHRYWGTR